MRWVTVIEQVDIWKVSTMDSGCRTSWIADFETEEDAWGYVNMMRVANPRTVYVVNRKSTEKVTRYRAEHSGDRLTKI